MIFSPYQSISFCLFRVFVFPFSLAMEFHEKLQSLAIKEGLKGSKVSRALESFSWNITILKVSHPPLHLGGGVTYKVYSNKL